MKYKIEHLTFDFAFIRIFEVLVPLNKINTRLNPSHAMFCHIYGVKYLYISRCHLG